MRRSLLLASLYALLCASTAPAASLSIVRMMNVAAHGHPAGNLVTDGSKLYGATSGGGPPGSIYRLDPDGSDFEEIHQFGPIGGSPRGGVTVSGGRVYGGITYFGTNGMGTIYSMATDGSDYQELHNFAPLPSSSYQIGPLVVDGTTIYGAVDGQTITPEGTGSVFRLNTDGSNYQALRSFTTPPYSVTLREHSVLYTATPGQAPVGDIHGRIYSLTSDGSVLNIMHQFNGINGSKPTAAMVQGGSMLYGTTEIGGAFGKGTVFRIGIDGSGFQVLHSFNNTDGANPFAELTILDGKLYGTTGLGGSDDAGTIFALNPDGSGFQTLHQFDVTLEGQIPSKLLAVGLTLYGTTSFGGTFNQGTIFALTVPEPSSLALAALGFAMLAIAGRRRRHIGSTRRPQAKWSGGDLHRNSD